MGIRPTWPERLRPRAGSVPYRYPIGTATGVLLLNQRVERRSEYDLARRCMGLEASANVDRVAECREVQHASRSHVANEGNARIRSYTDGQFSHL